MAHEFLNNSARGSRTLNPRLHGGYFYRAQGCRVGYSAQGREPGLVRIFFTSARQVLAQPRTVNASGRGTQALACFAVLRRALA